MRRTPIVLVMTAAGLTGLALYRTRPVASHLAGPSLSLSAGSAGSASGTSTSTPTSTSIPPTSTSPSTSTSATKANTGTSQTTTTTVPSTTLEPVTTTMTTVPSTTTTTPATTRQATGEVVDYSYGTLSVSVTVSGHTISKVSIASLDDGGNFRSQSIDEQSIPILEQETLQAQSANIQSVSGASYTSSGFCPVAPERALRASAS